MRVLWFEQRRRALHAAARPGRRAAAAMTSTHDLPTVAGWWRGRDLEWRAKLGLAGGAGQPGAGRQRARSATASRSGTRCATAARPQGEPPPDDDAGPFVDAAIAPCRPAPPATSCIMPIEDALGARRSSQPARHDGRQHPNWRRRLPGRRRPLLDDAATCAARLAAISEARTTMNRISRDRPPAVPQGLHPRRRRPRWCRISTGSASATSMRRRC